MEELNTNSPAGLLKIAKHINTQDDRSKRNMVHFLEESLDTLTEEHKLFKRCADEYPEIATELLEETRDFIIKISNTLEDYRKSLGMLQLSLRPIS